MTIEEIAIKLEQCARKKMCEVCKHSFYGLPTESCKEHMIKEMAEECRKIANELGDDCK